MGRMVATALCALLVASDIGHENPIKLVQEREMMLEEFSDVERLRDVDLSRKRVTVQYRVSEDALAAVYRQHAPTIHSRVREFYAAYGVEVVFLPSAGTVLDHDDIALEVLDERGFALKSVRSYLAVAEFDERRIFLKQSPDELVYSRTPERYIERTAETLSHEIGHMLSLLHSEIDSRDCIPDTLDGVDNLMRKTGPSADYGRPVGLVPVQVRQMHDFLAKGRTYEATGGEFPDYHRFHDRVELVTGRRHPTPCTDFK